MLNLKKKICSIGTGNCLKEKINETENFYF